MNDISNLVNDLGNADPKVRLMAGKALDRIGEGTLAKAVIGALENREGARETLARLASNGDRRAFEPLIERLNDVSWTTRRGACAALGRLQDVRALGPLSQMLKGGQASKNPSLDRDDGIRQTIAEALFQICRETSDIRSLDEVIALPFSGTVLTRLVQEIIKRAKESHPQEGYLCEEHLARFERRIMLSSVSGWDGAYLGCSVCGRTSLAIPIEPDSVIVCVISNDQREKVLRSGKILRVNWLLHGQFFGFHRVEISLANEVEIIRFLGLLRADPVVAKRCKQMRCTIGEGCKLRDQTERAVRFAFAQVEFEMSEVADH